MSDRNHSHTHGDANWSFQDVQNSHIHVYTDGQGREKRLRQLLTAPGAVPPEGFLGREEELQALRQRLTRGEGRTLALVNAEGGMGKTTLAARYWQRYGPQYQHLAWLFCQEGILYALRSQLPQALGLTEELKPYADDGEQQARFLRDYLTTLPPDCLLVLDNANNPDHIRGFLQVMGGLGWHVLITSRCAKVMPEPESEFPIEHLPPPLARELFVRHYREEGPDFEARLERFLRAVGYNTLCIEIYSKTLREGADWGLDFAGLLARLEQNQLTLGDDSFEISTDYTQNVQKIEVKSSDDLIEALYDVAGLDERHPELRDLLLQVALLPPETHPPQVLRALLSAASPQALKRQLDQLVRLGWLGSDGNGFRLSPVVQKIMLERQAERKWEVGEAMVGRLREIFAIESYLHLKNLAGAIPFAEITKEMLGYLTVEHSEAAKLYDGLWTFYQSTGNLASAIECARHEERIAIAIDDKYQLLVSCERLGTSYQSLGQFEQALAFFQKDLKLSEELCQANPHAESLKNGLAISYSKLGDIYKAQGQFEQALEFFQKETDLFEELFQANPHSESLKHGLAISYSKLGHIYQAQGKFEQALDFFQKYNELREALFQANPHSESLKHGLAISYEKLGNIYQAQGKFEQALDFFQKYNELREALFQANPHSESLKRGLAISYERLGNIYQAQGQFEQALDFFQKETDLFEALFQANPHAESLKNDLAISYSKLGNIYQAQGQFEQALECFQKYNELREALFQANPHSFDLHRGLAVSYVKLAGLFEAMEEKAQALDFYRRTRDMYRLLYEQTRLPELNEWLTNVETRIGELER